MTFLKGDIMMKQYNPNKMQEKKENPIIPASKQNQRKKDEYPHAPGAGSDKQHPDTPPPKDF